MVNWVLEIPEDPLGSRPVSGWKVVHVLVQLIDRESELRTREDAIEKGTNHLSVFSRIRELSAIKLRQFGTRGTRKGG
jgi:hypothetical protein